MTISQIVYLREGGLARRFAWFPVRLDAGIVAGRIVWMNYFYARPHSAGMWRDAYSIEERPSAYIDGRKIIIELEAE